MQITLQWFIALISPLLRNENLSAFRCKSWGYYGCPFFFFFIWEGLMRCWLQSSIHSKEEEEESSAIIDSSSISYTRGKSSFCTEESCTSIPDAHQRKRMMRCEFFRCQDNAIHKLRIKKERWNNAASWPISCQSHWELAFVIIRRSKECARGRSNFLSRVHKKMRKKKMFNMCITSFSYNKKMPLYGQVHSSEIARYTLH